MSDTGGGAAAMFDPRAIAKRGSIGPGSYVMCKDGAGVEHLAAAVSPASPVPVDAVLRGTAWSVVWVVFKTEYPVPWPADHVRRATAEEMP